MSQNLTDQGVLRFKPTTDLIATKIGRYNDLWNLNDLDKSSIIGVEIDMSEVKHMDSCGIGFLVSIYKEFKEDSIEFRLVNCNDYNKKLIKLVHLDKILTGESYTDLEHTSGR